jgi:hypothetical protein
MTELREVLKAVEAARLEILGALEERPATELVTVQEMAGILKVSPAHVYAHKRELGAIQVGASVRFHVMATLERARLKPGPKPLPSRRTRRTAGSDDELQPIV